MSFYFHPPKITLIPRAKLTKFSTELDINPLPCPSPPLPGAKHVSVRGWIGYSRGRRGVSASCRKNYMIAGNASFFPRLGPAPFPLASD